MYDHIVIAVDGSEAATRAARRGLDIADAFDAAVTVLHVVERKALRLVRADEERRRLEERGEAALGEVRQLAADRGQSVTTTLLEGAPAVRIGEYAAEQDADLVVLGRQGLTGLGRRLLGGVTENLLHRSDVPVLVSPGTDPETAGGLGYDRTLFPTDGSENAAAAVPHVAAVADRYDSAIHVLNVVDLQAAGGVFNAGGLETEFVERLEARGREAVDGVADELAAAAPDRTVTTAVERTASHSGVGAGIREYVAENDVDLVVMGSHGRSNVRRQFVGSVAATVLRSVEVPVLVVTRDA
jgi:nucleotide-binding universal stress UspA family protein